MIVCAVVIGVVGAGLAGCAHDERQWMKVNESYTAEEFRRDFAACSQGVTVDDECMRARGWVDVNPTAADRASTPPPPQHRDRMHR